MQKMFFAFRTNSICFSNHVIAAFFRVSYDPKTAKQELQKFPDPEGTMAGKKQPPPKPSFQPNYIQLVRHLAGAKDGINNCSFASYIGVSEGAIRKWRKEYPDFDMAFREAGRMLAVEVNQLLSDIRQPRKKVTIIETEEGEKTITEDVLPTIQDAIGHVKMGMPKPLAGFEEQQRREAMKAIRQRLLSGEISYLDAVDECEIEGLPVPSSWRAREAQRILSIPRSEEFTAVNVAQLLEASGLPVPRTLMLEVGKVIDLPPKVMAEIADMSPEDAADAYRKFMG
ncbi:TPA: hypothetical protein ACOEHG_004844 [Enterobacter ludwigii]